MYRRIVFIAMCSALLAGCDFSFAKMAQDTTEAIEQNDSSTSESGDSSNSNSSDSEGSDSETPNSDDTTAEKTIVELALDSGSVEDIESTDVLTTAVDTFLNTTEQQFKNTETIIFSNPANAQNLDAITWDPSHDAALLVASPGTNRPLLISNDSANGGENPAQEPLAIIGENSSRYLVMGGNPFRNAERSEPSVNEAMHQLMVNSIEWLTQKNATDIKQIVIAHLDQSYYFPDYSATTNWLTTRLNSDIVLNDRGTCDAELLLACLHKTTPPELLVISQKQNETTDSQQLVETIKQAQALGVAVLYVHHDGNLTDLGSALLSHFNVAYNYDNYWSKLRVSDASAEDLTKISSDELQQFRQFFAALEHDLWSFDLSLCDENCANQAAFANEFLKPAQQIRKILTDRDKKAVDLFASEDFAFEKYTLLLADKYRESVVYPMDKTTTPRADFMRALFADYAQYQHRAEVPVPNDLGNYSRTRFPGVTLTDTSINIQSRVSFRAAGVYALPGEQISVTRNDTADTRVYLQVNSIRNGATHIWDQDGFKRPVFLTSQRFELIQGETATFTSTYGGPIHLYFSNNDRDLSFSFNNVGLHPYWNGPEDDAAFQDGLDADLFDWAELSTPAFEVHSKIDKMRDSASDANWPNGAALAEATMTYTHNYPHVLAGFQGKGIDVVSEIHDFAIANNWQIDTLDKVKHMNADQATCGYGCSGNPYDAYWSFSPIGHGDIHELGHGLERGRFRFKTKDGSTWEGHATTNPYSYYSKSQYFKNTSQAPNCQNLPFDTLYQHLQSAQASSNAFDYMADLNLTGWNTGVATYIQFMMAAENQGVLDNGWHLWARLHLFDREFARADNDETTWQAKQASLGMANLSLAQAKALGNNDWMVLALSFISSKDYRPLFNLYGIAITEVAQTQLDLMSYPAIEAVFYGANDNNYCEGFDKPVLPLDGVSAWPY